MRVSKSQHPSPHSFQVGDQCQFAVQEGSAGRILTGLVVDIHMGVATVAHTIYDAFEARAVLFYHIHTASIWHM